MSVFEMAKKYYPHLWSAARIEALVRAGRLEKDEAERIMREAEDDADRETDELA